MGEIENFDDEAIASGLSGADIQAVAKRQFVASVAVAIVIALGVIVAMMMPASHDYAGVAASHKVATVQQPKFVAATDHVVAAKNTGIELP
jgi:hypothetical protein